MCCAWGHEVSGEIIGFVRPGFDTEDCAVSVHPDPGCVTVTITVDGQQYSLILGASAALRIGQELVEGSQFDEEDGYQRRRKSIKLVKD